MPSHYSSFASPTSPPNHRYRDHSPTKSSPLRHTISTRSNNSDTENNPIPSRQATVSSNASSGYSTANSSGYDVANDPFVTHVPSQGLGLKRDRSESPVKRNATFAKWEARERNEQELPSLLQEKITPKAGAMYASTNKPKDDAWKSSTGRSESRIALRSVEPNAIPAVQHHERNGHARSKTVGDVDWKRPKHESRPTSERGNDMSPPQNSLSHGQIHSRNNVAVELATPQHTIRQSPTSSNVSRNSLATLTRGDSVRASSRPGKTGHMRFGSVDGQNSAPGLEGSDLMSFSSSSTPYLRTLGTLTSENTEDLAIHSPEEQVTGLVGRKRLQRSGSVKPGQQNQSQFASQYASARWMDAQRRYLQAYEYLCHIGEARAWLEDVLDPTKLPPIVQLEEALRDGATLAEVVVRLAPQLSHDQQRALGSLRIFRSPRLQFRHSDNIAMFFRFLAEVELPELFRFELVDLYEKKNIPKVIYCIHALSWLLFRQGVVDFRIGNLVGQLHFEEHELEETQKGIDRSGVQMPNFGGMREAMQVEEEPPPPEPTPDERLAGEENLVLDLQSQIRAMLVRLQLGDVMNQFWDAEDSVTLLQAHVRGGFSRELYAFRHAMQSSNTKFQAAAKAFLVRQRRESREHFLAQNVDAVVKVQSLWRGRLQRAETKQIQVQLRSNRHGLKQLQAAIRGALGRWRAGDMWNDVQDAGEQVVEAQAMIRGAIERMRISATMNQLWDTEDNIVMLQAIARGARIRRRTRSRKAEARAAAVEITGVQAAVRGLLQRRAQKQQHGTFHLHEHHVVDMQSACRGLLQRLQQARLQGALQARERHITKLQSLLRAHGERRVLDQQQAEFLSMKQDTQQLQAFARACLTRKKTEVLRAQLAQHVHGISSLQSLIRAMLQRRRIGTQLGALEDCEDSVTVFQAIMRGYAERQHVFEHLVALEKEQDSIVHLQAACLAMLARSRVGGILAELEDHEAEIVEAQTACRAFVVRARFADKRRHYHENMQKVIKLQSYVRGKQQGESYKSLVSGKNPPLPVVRKHLHLLTDSSLEFESEIEAERLRRQVVESVRRNELVEGYVEGLDVKIALLVKNKITLDEVVRHQKHFGGSASQLLRHGSTLQSQSIDLKGLNKSSKQKLQGYEELFFTLQTQPQYLARLFHKLIQNGSLADKESKNLERLMMSLFGHAQKSREEYLLLKLLSRSASLCVEQTGNLDDFVRQSCASFHHRIFLGFVRSPRDRAYLKILMGGMVREGIVAHEHLDLESDPLQIHRSILNNEELMTGNPSQQPRDLPRDQAIRRPLVKQKFVENLQELRDLCDGFFISLEECLHRMPYGVRFMAGEQYAALCQQYPREDPSNLIILVGSWLWKSYLLPALKEPEMWGVIDRGLSPVHRRNLAQVTTVLNQVASGRLFGNENLYLQPLNNWISESLDRWQIYMQHIFDIPAPEERFDADQWSDLHARTKPTLYIKLADIFAIHSLIADNIAAVAPERTDLIKEMLTDLGTAKSNENDIGNGGSQNGEITLTLKSRFKVQEDPNAQWRQLFTATKRLVLYIIKVQSGTNLMEILLRTITEEDAGRWIALVHEELAEKDRPSHRRAHQRTGSFNPKASFRSGKAQSVYSEAPSTTFSEDPHDHFDLLSMSYAEVKGTALENIIALEQPHIPPQYRVSRHNNYQEILNALASDIRQKHRRRLERQQDVESTRATLQQLDSKAGFLEEQLKSYNDYIEQCLHTLATKEPNKRKFVMPFTKQWTHERELDMAGRKPKFGSYKYSARQLADKGVLLQWPAYAHEQWNQVDIVISSDEVGVFHVEASSGSMMLPGASANILLDDLLQAQYDNKQTVTVFEEAGKRGGAKLDVNLLLHLVFKKFYKTNS